MHSVLIVEDHFFTAEGLRSHMSQSAFQIAGVVATAAAGEKIAWEQLPDLILLDLHLPDEPSPRNLLQRFCHDVPWKVAVISSDDRPPVVEECIAFGVSAFLSKGEEPRVVSTALKLALADCGPIILTSRDNGVMRLSDAEKGIAHLLAQGLKYQDIGCARGTSAETVRKQCDRIQVKLGLSTREQLVVWSVENGYAAFR